jgi:prevent-host-death family protein
MRTIPAQSAWSPGGSRTTDRHREILPQCAAQASASSTLLLCVWKFRILRRRTSGEIMHHVTATELQRQFGRIKRIARREVVQVTDHGQVDFVMIPAEDYARMRRRDLVVAHIHDLPDATIEAIMSAGLDHLLEDD